MNLYQYYTNPKELYGAGIPYTLQDKRGSFLTFLNGELHSINDEPAVNNEHFKAWYKHGKRHRDNGPAAIWDDGSKVWFKNGMKHREDGPAYILRNGEDEYYFLNDKEYLDQYEYELALDKLNESLTEDKQINWTFPNQKTLQADYTEYKKKEERKWKGRARQLGARFPIFKDFDHFVQSLKNADIRTLDNATDLQIYNRSHTGSIEDLKRLVNSYYKPRDVDRIVRGYTEGAQMPYPIVIEGNNGAWIMAGNTRLDVAGIMGLPKKVLWVDVKE